MKVTRNNQQLMSNFEDMFLLARKISDRGLGWVLDRLKQELRSPRYSVMKSIAARIESFRVLIRRLTQTSHVDNDSDHLLVVYDLNNSPITFDFAYFLADAETFARTKGKETLFVYFVMENNKLQSENVYAAVVDEISQKWRFNHIIIPLVNVYPACVGYSVLSKEDSVKHYRDSALIFPKGYSDTFKPLMNYNALFKNLQSKSFEGIRASEQSIRYIDKWRQSKGIISPIICITLRQYGYDTSRNSNISAWARFADWASERGYTPVFIPDTDACWEPHERIDKYQVFNEGCWNLELRLALYELAYVNYFYSNGCGALATLSKNIRYILMIPILEHSLQAKSGIFKSYGWSPDQRRLNFAEKYQFLSFKTDSFKNILDEFLQFTAVND